MNFSIIPWIAGLLGLAIVIGFGVSIKHKLDRVPVLEQQLHDQKAAYERKLSDQKTTLDQTTQAYQRSEKLRTQEQTAAKASLSSIQIACEARIAEAKRSAGAIQVITHEVPKYDKSNCPVRAMLGNERLRLAIGAHR